MPTNLAPVSILGGLIQPYSNAGGTGGTTGINYFVIAGTADATGIIRCNGDFRIYGNGCGLSADVNPKLTVAAHFFAFDSTTAVGTADTVATWAGTGVDIQPNRTAKTGYTYLNTYRYNVEGEVIQLTQPMEGASYEDRVNFNDNRTQAVACIEAQVPLVTNRENIVCVLVASGNMSDSPANLQRLSVDATMFNTAT